MLSQVFCPTKFLKPCLSFFRTSLSFKGFQNALNVFCRSRCSGPSPFCVPYVFPTPSSPLVLPLACWISTKPPHAQYIAGNTDMHFIKYWCHDANRSIGIAPMMCVQRKSPMIHSESLLPLLTGTRKAKQMTVSNNSMRPVIEYVTGNENA